jgi:hypothetical protein
MGLCTLFRRLADLCEDGCDARLVPAVLEVREQTGPAKKTPEYQRTPKGDLLMLLKLRDHEQATIAIRAFKSRKGNPAEIDGAPEWFTGNSELVAVEPASDGMSCLIKAVGPLGDAVVSVKVDADLGEGVTDLHGRIEVKITGGPAETSEFGEPTVEEQPEGPAASKRQARKAKAKTKAKE